jgi:hypothetical protein
MSMDGRGGACGDASAPYGELGDAGTAEKLTFVR